MSNNKCFQTSVRANALSVVAALAGLAFAAPFALGDVDPMPTPQGERLVFDLTRAIVRGTRTTSDASHAVEAALEEKQDGVRIVLNDFEFSSTTAKNGLTERFNLRAAIPVQAPRGLFPSSLSAKTSLRVSKQEGVLLSAALLLRAFGLGNEVANETWARGDALNANLLSLTQEVGLNGLSSELRRRLCDVPGGAGMLTADIAMAAERELSSLSYFVTGTGEPGPSQGLPLNGAPQAGNNALVIDVVAGPLVPCGD